MEQDRDCVHEMVVNEVTIIADEALAESSEALVADLAEAAAVTNRALTSHGMQVDWEPGKSEALVLWHGHGFSLC